MRDIRRYEGIYAITETGRVWSYPRRGRKGKWICVLKRHDGYLQARLHKEGKGKNYLAHRLVADTFIVHPEGAECVNHKNGKKDDNRVSNLEWVTFSENTRHSDKMGLRKKKLNAFDLSEIKLLHSRKMRIADIASLYKVCPSTISSIITNKKWGSWRLTT